MTDAERAALRETLQDACQAALRALRRVEADTGVSLPLPRAFIADGFLRAYATAGGLGTEPGKCPGCGVAEGSEHTPTCDLLAWAQ